MASSFKLLATFAALFPLAIASPCHPPHPSVTHPPGDDCSTRTVCADYIETCPGTEYGSSTLLTYGGCFPDCKPWPTFTPPPCPTVTKPPTCTNTNTVCQDNIKTCTEGGISTEIMYGGCFPDCKPWPTFTEPPCPTITDYPTVSCTNTNSVCVDNIKTCTVGGTTTQIPYGGCFADCQPWPTFPEPPCPTATDYPTASCTNTKTICSDALKTCTEGGVTNVLTYGGCYPDCKPYPTFTEPPCPTITPPPADCSATATSTCLELYTRCGTTAFFSYGGCFPDCKPYPTFTPPPCPTTTPI